MAKGMMWAVIILIAFIVFMGLIPGVLLFWVLAIPIGVILGIIGLILGWFKK